MSLDGTATPERALDAVEEVFRGRGIPPVGMDDIRGASGVPGERLYQRSSAKDQLPAARPQRLAEFVARREDPEERILAVFDRLEAWFGDRDLPDLPGHAAGTGGPPRGPLRP